MSSAKKDWLKETKGAVEITLKRTDYEHELSADDILNGLTENAKEKKVFEVAFVLHTINDDILIWINSILRVCMKYIDSIWIMLSQPPYSLLRGIRNNHNIDIDLNIKQIDYNLIIQLFHILNECSIKYRLCLQAMDFSHFALPSYHYINKSIIELLSISNRKKSIFFVPVLSKNWLTFYKNNNDEFIDLLNKIKNCQMINSLGIWMRNEFISNHEINKQIIPIIKAMTMNENVAFLMFRFDLMLTDNNNSNDNDKLFDEIASCLLNKKLSSNTSNNQIIPYWKNASRIPFYLSNSSKDSAISLSFRVDKYFHRDFLYGNNGKLCKLLTAINKNDNICCNRIAISRGDTIIHESILNCISNIIINHNIHSLEQIIIDGYIHDITSFVDVLIHQHCQLKNISLHTIKISKILSMNKMPESMIKLIQSSNKMMNYIGISIDAYNDELGYKLIDAFLFRIYKIYQTQLGIKDYFENTLNKLLPFDIVNEIIDFCKMDCFVVSIQMKLEIAKKMANNFEIYRKYFIQSFEKLFNEKEKYENACCIIAINEVALYIGEKVNMHEFTQNDTWRISP